MTEQQSTLATTARENQILLAVDKLRQRKARPDLFRILAWLSKRYDFDRETVETMLENMVRQNKLFRVCYKGDISYRNPKKYAKWRSGSMTVGGEIPQEEELPEESDDMQSSQPATADDSSAPIPASSIAAIKPSATRTTVAAITAQQAPIILHASVDRTSDRLNMAVKQLIEFDKKEDYRHRGVPLQAVMEFMHQMFPEWKFDLSKLLGMLRAETLKNNSRLMELAGQRFRLRPVRNFNPKDAAEQNYSVMMIETPPVELNTSESNEEFTFAVSNVPSSSVAAAGASTTTVTASTSATASTRRSVSSSPFRKRAYRRRGPPVAAVVPKRKYSRKPKTMTALLASRSAAADVAPAGATFNDCGDISSPSPTNFRTSSTTPSTSAGSPKRVISGRLLSDSSSPFATVKRLQLQKAGASPQRRSSPSKSMQLHDVVMACSDADELLQFDDVGDAEELCSEQTSSTTRRSYRARKPKLHRLASSEVSTDDILQQQQPQDIRKLAAAKKSKLNAKRPSKTAGKKFKFAEQQIEDEDTFLAETSPLPFDNTLDASDEDEDMEEIDGDEPDSSRKMKRKCKKDEDDKSRRPGWQRGRPRKIAPMLERMRRHTLAGRGYVLPPQKTSLPIFTHYSDYESLVRNFYCAGGRHNFIDQQQQHRYCTSDAVSFQNEVRRVARETICPLLSIPDWVANTVLWWTPRHVGKYFESLGFDADVLAAVAGVSGRQLIVLTRDQVVAGLELPLAKALHMWSEIEALAARASALAGAAAPPFVTGRMPLSL